MSTHSLTLAGLGGPWLCILPPQAVISAHGVHRAGTPVYLCTRVSCTYASRGRALARVSIYTGRFKIHIPTGETASQRQGVSQLTSSQLKTPSSGG